MYVIDLKRFTGFEWDQGNLDKSYQKRGVTPNEAEEVFLDEKALFVEDIDHSQKEERLIAIGKTVREKLLFIAFTPRSRKIRIISARSVNTKERRQYEKIA